MLRLLKNRRTQSLFLALGVVVVGFWWWRTRPSPALQSYNQGKSLELVKMTGEALDAYKEAIRLDARFAPPYRAMAELATANGETAASIGWWKAFLERDPKAEHALCRLAQAEALNGLEKPAMKDAERELIQDPTCSRAHLALGILYARKSEATPAIEHLSVASKAYPDDPQIQLVYGKVLTLSGNYAQAEPTLKHIIEKDKRHAAPYLWLGYLFARRSALPEDQKQAETFLRQALRLQPELPDANYELGRLLLLQQRAKEAAPLLQKAVLRKRHNVAALYSLAQAYTALGQKESALQTQKAFRRESDFAARERVLLKSYVVNPNDIEIQLQLGLLELERGEPQAALIFLRSASLASPKDARISTALQKAEQLMKQQDPAPSKTP